MPINPALTQRLVQIAAQADAAAHGQKQALYAQACAELGLSLPTLHRYLGQVALRAQRKQRQDAGDCALPREEALLLSAFLMESMRKNNKRLLSIGQALSILRANGEVKAERINPATGEVTLLSESAVSRALRTYSLHPDQLLRPAPATELRSLHPNHVWQIDASLCVLYYLRAQTESQAGLQVMQAERFYKNKPANIKSIESERVWSYEVTDHNSGCIFVHYVVGSESGHNLAESFIAAIQQRGTDPMHGVPHILMLDMGSANTSGMFKNLCRRLQVQLLPHMPGNARATGQVEQARNIIETSFESGLKFQPVDGLEALNTSAQRWARWFNAHKVHSRHGKTRFDQWLTITADQLRLAPSPDLCRELVTHEPERRKVNDFLRVQFKGAEYDVRSVPGVMVGEALTVTYSPYQQGAALVLLTDADGKELLHSVPLVARNTSGGFAETANVIGEDYKRHHNTQADLNRAAVEQAAMQAASATEAQAKRKAKALPFGGRIDPFKPITDTPTPAYLPRTGTELAPHVTAASSAQLSDANRVLTRFEVASELARRGLHMTPERNAQIAAWYPQGVHEADVDAIEQRLTVRASLRVVAGGAAND